MMGEDSTTAEHEVKSSASTTIFSTFGKKDTKEIEIVKFDSVDYSHPSGVAALVNVSLSITRGEFVAVLGTNGAGKSTLVRHINGLLKPTHGTVSVFGESTRERTSAFLSRGVGMVFQNANNQLFAQTVRQELEFALKNFGFDRQTIQDRVEWALNTFSLKEYVDKPPMELSGGEKKRLCIALVLAWDPEILILDEPTVGQDYEQKALLGQIIMKLLGEGKTVMVVTHDVEFIWPLQPRVILMSQGRIIADGSSQEILGNPAVLSKGDVLPPQLVELSRLLGWKNYYPKDVFEAESRIIEQRYNIRVPDRKET
ncbi:MAG TPA: ABC transporter ATP-binding protein [Nitrososphaerales archaeon]|nr:ABC transporter ATP-binding protein [Nitrososphaerales archaeon]